jgi:molecular chaperone DnaJ
VTDAMAKDYYDVLGVGKNANGDEIKNAYRNLALKFHPDINKDKKAEETFKEINEAYAVLSDPDKRSQYDSFGPDVFNQRYTQEDIFRNFDFESVFRSMGMDFGFDNSLLEQMFGFRAPKRGDIGNDIIGELRITPSEAAHGAEKNIAIPHIKVCDACKGRGVEHGGEVVRCDKCNGRGSITVTRRTGPMIMHTTTTCGNCGGSGKIITKPCRKCGGRGRVSASDKVVVKVPRGDYTGKRLRLQGMGDYGSDRTGDFYVVINVLDERQLRNNRRWNPFDNFNW